MGLLGFLSFIRAKKRPKPSLSKPRKPSKAESERKKIAQSFGKVKRDMHLVASWLKHLKRKDAVHEQRYAAIQRELGGLAASSSSIKNDIAAIKEEIKALQELKKGSLTNLIRTESEPVLAKRKNIFEQKVVSVVRSRRKEYIINQILSYAAKGNCSTKEIETIIVNEKMLCGRTAFYDYLRELKHKKLIAYAERGTKKVLQAL